MQNQEMNGLSQVAKDLENSCSELDRKITVLKNQAQCSWAKIYSVSYYDGDDTWKTIKELYSTKEQARLRFCGLIPKLFPYEMKSMKLENVNWNEVYDFYWDDFEFSKDCYEKYLREKELRWEEPNPIYKKYTWKAFCPNWYSELLLEEIEIWEQNIDAFIWYKVN